MIDSVAKLLDAIAATEAALIDSQGTKHAPTIGGMYEHLTANVLNRALPIDQPLQVVSGFIRQEDGTDSREMDCMVVLGDVEDIPYSPKKRVPRLSQVVAVVQVKKSIASKDFEDGHENIKSVRSIKPDAACSTVGQVERAFELITRMPLVEPVAELPPLQQMLFHLLRVHLNTPACIVLGYHGYKGHRAFREGLGRHLRSTIGRPNYGPMSLPDVIVNTEVAAVKNIALPWNAPIQGERWPVYMTARIHSPHAILLEAIWTRLVFRGLLGDQVFGEDLDIEGWHLLASMGFDASVNGWSLKVHDDADVPEEPEAPQRWSPVELTLQQYVVMNELCNSQDGSLCIPSLSAAGLTEADVAFLNSQGLVGRDPRDSTVYRLLTRGCACMILPDGRYVAGENNAGRLSRWLDGFVAARGNLENPRPSSS